MLIIPMLQKRRRTCDGQTIQNDGAFKNESHPMKVSRMEKVSNDI